VLKFDKKEQTDEEVIHEDSKQLVGVDDKVLNSNTEPDNKSRLSVNISYAFNPEGRHNAKKEILIRF
jgi:hypothetical protein